MPRDTAPRPKTLRHVRDLADRGLADAAGLPVLEQVAAQFAVAVTPAMTDLIDPADPNDPVARQFLPDPRELDIQETELADPIGDDPFTPVKGIVHRYRDRVLLKPVHACPVYCRFCFRREMVGPGADALTADELDRAIAYIAGNAEIWEVILTGGDPMILSPRRMGAIIARLNAIPHLGSIRIHTRVPLVDPVRVDADMVAALKGGRIPTWVVLHSNHWKEFAEDGRAAVARLVDAGIPMLGQTVLMRDINDDADTLARTFRTMVTNRIKPYHLNHGDLAKGTSHFRTSVAAGRTLVKALRGDLSGICQPTYILDIPGGHGKVPLGAAYLMPAAGARAGGADGTADGKADGAGEEDGAAAGPEDWLVEDPHGHRHHYRG
ncbi:lysine-2,3-aminomutase-like protein [Niveispirillum fermenti]|uniref:lysine-2,3-aminomutase-like protein n=1 Tax=Niveispirillum fermenti TaxID=1233113 RepID=UPI003A84196A